MNRGFWKQLAKPFFVLAPMADVTDSAFRQIIAKYGKPDAFFTEFVSTDGLCSIGRKNVMMDLYFTESERPIVAQIWGRNPEHFYTSALLLQELGFDGIDINMGCPDANVCKQGGGAALLKEPELAQTIIRETKRGAGKLPVSVKTRMGYNVDILEDWIPKLLETEPALITVHGRTKKEMSDVPAHWDRIGRAAEIVRSRGSKTLILGNGDVQTLFKRTRGRNARSVHSRTNTRDDRAYFSL
ncbi:tRNA-dihydrouridine synthase family protein [Candidatus Peregrinibacteria bacterium]|nr:tRNA-dihydrouridine synthase family protein [Candidatus Peregrinibacteria bacterium]